MAKISGIYVEIRGDATQLKKEMASARDMVTRQAHDMSNAMNNALSPQQLKGSINSLVKNLNQLSQASKVTGKDFSGIGADLGHLQKLTGLTAAEFGVLQSKMMATQAAKAQENALRSIAKAANLTNAEIQKLGAQMNVSQAGIGNVIGKTQGATDAMGGLVSIGRTAAGVFGGMILAKFAMELAELPGQVIQAGIAFDSLERSMYAVTGSATAAAETLGFIRKEADRLGQNFYAIAPEFKNMAAAARGTAMEGEEARKLFTAITGASTALGLSIDDTHGTLRALQQMMSKGKIQAEELRGQLGERLPGALKLMADGMGVSTAELNKMMEQGKLLADDALPKLTVQINKMYQAAAEKAALESGQAAVNKLSQAWTELKVNLFDADAFVWATNKVTGLMNSVNSAIAPTVELRIANMEGELSPMLNKRGDMIQQYGVAAGNRNEFKVLNKQIEDLQRNLRRAKEELQWMTDPAKDGFLAMSSGMEKAATRSSVYTAEVEKGREALAKYIQTAKEKAKADYDSAVKFANSKEEEAKALAVYQEALARLDKKESAPGLKAASASAKSYEQMIEDGKKAAESLEKYWNDYEDGRVKAVADGVDERAKAQVKDLALVTEFADKYKEVVLGETAFKLAQIDAQGDAYRKAGADEVAVAQYVKAEKLKVSREWSDGVQRGLAEYADGAMNAAALAEDAITNGFKGMEDALVEFVKTGKFEFSDFADSVISDLARIAIQQSITGPLASGAGDFLKYLMGGGASSAAGTAGVTGTLSSFMSRSAKGNVFSGPGISAFSNSIVTQPTQFWANGGNLMGEAGPEAIMPLKRGPDGTLGVSGGGSNVVVNIIESPGNGGKTQQRQENGVNILDVMVEQIKSSIASDINRGSGVVPQAITKSYGLSRAPGAY